MEGAPGKEPPFLGWGASFWAVRGPALYLFFVFASDFVPGLRGSNFSSFLALGIRSAENTACKSLLNLQLDRCSSHSSVSLQGGL